MDTFEKVVDPGEGGFISVEAARRHPLLVVDGKPVHLATLMRWIYQGLRGVKREARVVGGRLAVSHREIQEFNTRLEEKRLLRLGQPNRRAIARRNAEAAAAEKSQKLRNANRRPNRARRHVAAR